MSGEPDVVMSVLAERVRAALESGDVAAFADLLDERVRWGAPGDPSPPCQNRDQVLQWYERGRAAGRRARVVSVEALGDRLLVELVVAEADAPQVERPRWQVLTCAGGRVVDIRGYDRRLDAMAQP